MADADLGPLADLQHTIHSNGQQREKRARATKALPTDRIKLGKQLDILRAYVGAGGVDGRAVSNTEVAQIVQMQPSTVSMGNAFWTDVGFLQKGEGGYLPSQDVVNFSRAHEWNPDSAPHKLAPLLENAWFVTRLMPKLRFREVKEEEALIDLADEAGAGLHHKGQLRLLLEYMEVTGFVTRENGSIRLDNSRVGPSTPSEPQKPESAPPASPNITSGPLTQATPTSHAPPPASIAAAMSGGGVQFDFSIRVGMAEIAGWPAERITAFFAGLAQVIAARGKVD
jgi:hypothetical protein